MGWPRRAFAVLVAASGLVSCSSDGASAKPITYGAATISPSVVTVGSSFVFTPTKVISPNCGFSADIYRAVEGMPKYAQFNPDGSFWRYGGPGPEPTVLACGPPPWGKPVKYTTKPDFPVGTWVMCMSIEPTKEGCATFRTVKG